MSQFISQQDTVDEYKEWFYPTGKIGHKLLYITNIFSLCHVFHTQHGVIQQSNMRAGVIQVCLHTVSWIKQNHSSCSFFIYSYKFWLPFSCYDILCWQKLINRINRIQSKYLEQITLFVSFRQEWLVLNIFSNHMCKL